MSIDELIAEIIDALEEHFNGSEADRIADENSIGLSIDGKNWFINVEEC